MKGLVYVVGYQDGACPSLLQIFPHLLHMRSTPLHLRELPIYLGSTVVLRGFQDGAGEKRPPEHNRDKTFYRSTYMKSLFILNDPPYGTERTYNFELTATDRPGKRVDNADA
jgi:hypothetical protein